MSLTLKDCLNPWKAADGNIRVSGQLPVAGLDRLAGALLEINSDVDVNLEFKRTEEKLPILEGSLSGLLTLECQRCLEPMDLQVQSKFSMAFIRPGTTLDSEIYDLYEVEDEQICLTNVIEDELLLLLPQVPMHSDPVCVIETEFGDGIIEDTAEEKENPFAVLASLKDKLNN